MAEIRHFFDAATSTLTYVVSDPSTRDAVVVDPVLDYDPVAHRVSASTVVAVESHLRESGLKPRMILETHAHADHLSSAQHLKSRFNCPVVIGARIREVQAAFRDVLALGQGFRADGSEFDRLIEDGEELAAGSLKFRAIGLPGHTPACMGYAIGDAIFVGDAIFMPDQGTGRCDFPGGSAESLFDSITKLYALPPHTKLYVGHDYQPGGRELRFQTTVADSREKNVHLKASTTRAEFLAFRRGRDAGLPLPKLLYPSIQVNIRGGRLPEPEAGGKRFLRIPLEIDQKAPPCSAT